MFNVNKVVNHPLCYLMLGTVAMSVVVESGWAGGRFFRDRSVGGISIDGTGVVARADVARRAGAARPVVQSGVRRWGMIPTGTIAVNFRPIYCRKFGVTQRTKSKVCLCQRNTFLSKKYIFLYHIYSM